VVANDSSTWIVAPKVRVKGMSATGTGTGTDTEIARAMSATDRATLRSLQASAAGS
jgi:hypothetical protein